VNVKTLRSSGLKKCKKKWEAESSCGIGVGRVEYGEKKTARNSRKSTDGQFGIDVVMRQASGLVHAPYHC